MAAPSPKALQGRSPRKSTKRPAGGEQGPRSGDFFRVSGVCGGGRGREGDTRQKEMKGERQGRGKEESRGSRHGLGPCQTHLSPQSAALPGPGEVLAAPVSSLLWPLSLGRFVKGNTELDSSPSRDQDFFLSIITLSSSSPQGSPKNSATVTSGHQRDQEIRGRKNRLKVIFLLLLGGEWQGEV